MTETTPVANPMEMVVTTNTAPVEQKSPEMVTTEPKTDLALEPKGAEEVKPEIKTEEKPPEKTAEDRANELARERFQEKMRADNAESQLKALKPIDKELGDRPKIDNFDTLENFEKALIGWAEKAGSLKEREATSLADRQRQESAFRATVATREEESRVKHADFDKVVGPLVPVIGSIPILKDFIARNPMGTEVAYELAKNPAVLDQLMRSDTWTAGEQLLNMAARLKKPAPVSISNAPEPIKPVGSRETVKPKLAELAVKDINGYMAKRNKDELAKRRAN